MSIDVPPIHERKLGKLPPIPGRASLRFADFVTAELPDVPLSFEPPELSWPMDLNDRYGTCVVAGWDHTRQLLQHELANVNTNLTEQQIIELYRTQNPNHPPQDDGMYIQVFLEELTRRGDILGFARIDQDDPAAIKAGVYLGLSLMIGAMLDTPQVGAQFDRGVWDYVPNSRQAGGHCVNVVGARAVPGGNLMCVTWARVVDLTPRFMAEQCDEVWFVLTQAHVDHPGFRAGFDLPKFARAYEAITGRTFPVTVTPPPEPPVEPPTPERDPIDELMLDYAVKWLNEGHYFYRKTLQARLRAWVRAKRPGALADDDGQ